MHRSLRLSAAAFAGVVLAAPAAKAQSSRAVAQAPNSIELGADAGLTIGLGDNSYFTATLPAQRARVGFFLNNQSRWSVEPAVGLGFDKPEGQKGTLGYDLEVGALYHFRPPQQVAEVAAANRVSVGYLRPFVNYSGTTGGGTNDGRFSLGGGVGVKVPFRTNIAFRAEANLGYDFDNDAARLGALLGLSFFTRRGS